MQLSLERYARGPGAATVALLLHVPLLIALLNGGIGSPGWPEKAPTAQSLILVPTASPGQPHTLKPTAPATLPAATHQAGTPQAKHPVRPSSSEPATAPLPAASETGPAGAEASSSHTLSSPGAERSGSGQQAPLDLDAMKKTARDMARDSKPRTLPGATPHVSESGKLAHSMEQAARADCVKQYGQMGLLAIPFLLKDSVSDSGCKW